MIINAFHPDYVKTHMPQFLTAVKQEQQYATSATNLSKTVTKMRRTKPLHGNVAGMSTRESATYQPARDMGAFPKTRRKESIKSLWAGANMTMAEVAQELTAAQKARLAPREFHTFTKAGYAKKK
jgi:hypothetical protein